MNVYFTRIATRKLRILSLSIRSAESDHLRTERHKQLFLVAFCMPKCMKFVAVQMAKAPQPEILRKFSVHCAMAK